MRTLSALGLAAMIVVVGGPVQAQDDHAKKIVGKWVVDKSEDLPDGATVEFTKDGKLTVVAKADGKELKLEGTYKIEKDKITTKITFNGKAIEDTDDIIKLTDEVLELRDKDKKVTTFKKKK